MNRHTIVIEIDDPNRPGYFNRSYVRIGTMMGNMTQGWLWRVIDTNGTAQSQGGQYFIEESGAIEDAEKLLGGYLEE